MPIKAIRRRLEAATAGVSTFDHPGLALHRYLTEHADQQQKRKGCRPEVDLLQKAANSSAPEAYKRAFAAWGRTLAQRGSQPFTAELAAPLAVGLGNESPLEVGLTLHHTYGMPFIPGSALKGLCRRGACRSWGVEKPEDLQDEAKCQLRALFGDTEDASHFVFWDAWYDPASLDGKPFKRDVITVHHPKYYQQRGKDVWPTDFDDPNPVPFLVVRPGARFLFAVDAPTQEWGACAVSLLRWSLENLGVGGKTNAGYGYFQFQQSPVAAHTSQAKGVAAPTAPPAPQTLRWAGVLLRLDPPTGDIHATFQSSQKAVARRAERERVLEALNDEQRRRLLEKGQPRRLEGVTVEVEALGNAWKLLRVEPLEE